MRQLSSLKKGLLAVCILCLSFTAQAQNTSTDSIPNLPSFRTRWLAAGMGWNSLYYNNNAVDFSPFQLNTLPSIQYDVSIFRQYISLYQQKLNIEYGFAFEFNRFDFNSSSSIAGQYSELTLLNYDTVQVKRNSYHTFGISVPLLLRYETKPTVPHRSFHIAAGGYIGLRMSDKTKLRIEGQKTQSFTGDFITPELKYGLQGEIGYANFTLFYRFDLQPFFMSGKDKGFVMYPMLFGLRLPPLL